MTAEIVTCKIYIFRDEIILDQYFSLVWNYISIVVSHTDRYRKLCEIIPVAFRFER